MELLVHREHLDTLVRVEQAVRQASLASAVHQDSQVLLGRQDIPVFRAPVVHQAILVTVEYLATQVQAELPVHREHPVILGPVEHPVSPALVVHLDSLVIQGFRVHLAILEPVGHQAPAVSVAIQASPDSLGTPAFQGPAAPPVLQVIQEQAGLRAPAVHPVIQAFQDTQGPAVSLAGLPMLFRQATIRDNPSVMRRRATTTRSFP